VSGGEWEAWQCVSRGGASSEEREKLNGGGSDLSYLPVGIPEHADEVDLADEGRAGGEEEVGGAHADKADFGAGERGLDVSECARGTRKYGDKSSSTAIFLVFPPPLLQFQNSPGQQAA
jgi:hypothetical protein